MNKQVLLKLASGGGLIILALSLPATRLIEQVTPFYNALFAVALALVIALAGAMYWLKLTFGETVHLGDQNVPRFLFLALCLTELLLFTNDDLKSAVPGATISILLTWYGATLIFGTFFFGRSVALFFYSPFSWIASLKGGKGAPGA